MPDVAVFSHPVFSRHITPAGHPERPERCEAMQRALSPFRDRLTFMPGPMVDTWLLEQVHAKSHIKQLREACEDSSWGDVAEEDMRALWLPTAVDVRAAMQPNPDTDTFVCGESWAAAMHAAGASAAAVDGVISGKFRRAFCAVRPPGHHAGASRSMGFCLLNNVALAAQQALNAGVQRVAILDWDVHHGNGT